MDYFAWNHIGSRTETKTKWTGLRDYLMSFTWMKEPGL